MACELSALGFPIDWCVFALKYCEDDTARAADFILTNIGNLEALVRDEAEEKTRRFQNRQEKIRCKSLAPQSPSAPLEILPIDAYGMKFTAIPEFTTAGRRLLAVKHAAILEKLHKFHCQFTLKHDEDITALIDEACSKNRQAQWARILFS